MSVVSHTRPLCEAIICIKPIECGHCPNWWMVLTNYKSVEAGMFLAFKLSYSCPKMGDGDGFSDTVCLVTSHWESSETKHSCDPTT